jgi:tetratricopeptide (TPR) repeat protein
MFDMYHRVDTRLCFAGEPYDVGTEVMEVMWGAAMTVPTRQVWMIPRRRDPDFVGRNDELAALEAALKAAGGSALTQPVAVHGLGGVGKTLLAVEFAFRHADDYNKVLWLAAEEPTTLASSFANLARELGLRLAEKSDQAVRTAAVLRWMESNDRWLLVFDNAVRREDVESYVPQRHAGHVLITSRNPDWQPLARPLKVRTLLRPDSVGLLRGDPPQGDEAEADRLADALGDLPLALAQAAAYIRETARPFAEYLQRFQAQEAAFEGEQAEPGYGQTVAATLELALSALGRGDGEAFGPGDVLARCAFYAPDLIPRELLEADFPDGNRLDASIRELRRYSLVETGAGLVSVHRLVQRAAQMRMTSAERLAFSRHAVELLKLLFPKQPDDVRTWPACERLLDHAIHVTQDPEGSGDAGVLVAVVLDRVGGYFRSRSDLRQAKGVLSRALELKEAAHGSEHPAAARTLTSLGLVAFDERDLPEAWRFEERALHIFEKSYGPDHPSLAGPLNNLGIVAREQGNLADARQCLERALRIDEAAHGPDHPNLAGILTNLGLVAHGRGDLAEARRCQERALHILEEAYGPEWAGVARILTNLADVARDEGDLAEARRGLERALRMQEATFGPDHPDVAITLNSLGLVAHDRWDLVEARRSLERAQRINEAAYGLEHPQVAHTLGNLGIVAQAEGNLAEARRCFERAQATFRKFLGDDHPATARALNDLRSLDEPSPEPRSTAGDFMSMKPSPKAFISYSWDDDAHSAWVLELATRLREDGVDVTLDRGHAVPDDQLPALMERVVHENDFVITICTPKFKVKADGRSGGVVYEGDIMTSEVFTSGNQRKFVPILRQGRWTEAAPSWLLGKYHIDLSGDPYSKSNYDILLRILHGELEHPPVGPRPDFGAMESINNATPATGSGHTDGHRDLDRPARTTLPPKILCPLHGIRTHAEWQRGLSDLATSRGWVCRLERWSYGRFSLPAFLTPLTREAKLGWLRRQYDAEMHDRRLDIKAGRLPSIVAHSFGTYILGYALLRFDTLRFNKVILCGSILPLDFPWDRIIARGQVQAVRNEFGVRDPWVRRVCWFVRDTGPSGAVGFVRKHERLEQEEFDFDHSEYFDAAHMEDRWLPFLDRPLEPIPRSRIGDRIPRPKPSRPWALYGILMVLVAISIVSAIVAYRMVYPPA